MSWFRLSPEDLTDDPIFLRLKAEPALLYTLLAMRSLRRGPLAPDKDLYQMLWGSKFRAFDSAWKVVTEAVATNSEGLLVFEWADDAREDSEGRSKDEREKKAKQRSRVQEGHLSRGRPGAVPVLSPGCPQPLSSVSPPTDGRTDEQTDSTDKPPAPLVAEDKPRRERKPASGPVADCLRHWESEWSRTRLGTKCAIQAKDGVAVAWMTKQADEHEVHRRMTAILEDPDAWVAQNASLTLLRSKWDRFACKVVPSGGRNGGLPTGLAAVAAVAAMRGGAA